MHRRLWRTCTQERGHGADVDRTHFELGQYQPGQTFALFVIAVAAAEVGVGLALVLLIYRNRRTIALDDLSEMKG